MSSPAPPPAGRLSTKAAILGLADGTVTIIGVIAGGAAAGIPHAALAVTAIGGALAATVSMAGAEMLSETDTDWAAVAGIGAGTVIGGGIPAVPLILLGGTAGWLCVTAIALTVAAAVGETRYRSTRRGRLGAYVLTAAVLVLGAAVGWAAGRLF